MNKKNDKVEKKAEIKKVETKKTDRTKPQTIKI